MDCRYKLWLNHGDEVVMIAMSNNAKLLWNLSRKLRGYRVMFVDQKKAVYKDIKGGYSPVGDTAAPVYSTDAHRIKKMKPNSKKTLHYYTSGCRALYAGDVFEIHIDGVIDATIVLQDEYSLTEEELKKLYDNCAKIFPKKFKIFEELNGTLEDWRKQCYIQLGDDDNEDLL